MVAVKTGMIAPPSMPQNMMPPPMPVPPMGQQMMPPQQMPIQQGTAPVAPMTRSNAGRRRRFGDRLESMLASNQPPVASDQMASMNVFTGQMPRRQMPRGQMMGGTAIQPPVRRMMGGGAVPIPRETDIYGQPHMLAYINPEEADLLQGLGGMGTPGPGGVPQYNWFSDFIDSITGGGKSSNTGGSSSSPSYASPSSDPYAEDRGGSSSGPGFDPSAPPDTGGYFDSPKPPPSKPAPPVFDISVSPGDDKPTVTVPTTPTYGIPSNSETGGYDEVPVITPPNTGVIGGYDPIGGGSVDDGGVGSGSGVIGGYDPIGGGSVDDVGIGAPPNTGVVGGYDPIGGGSVDDVGIGAPPSTPGTGGGDDDDDGGVNLEPVFYDMFGNAYKTEAEARAADAEHLRKQQAAADAEAERKRMEQLAELERQAAEQAAAAEARRRQAAAEANMGLDPFGGTGGPDDPLYVSDVFETPPNYEQAQAEAEMGLDPFGGEGDPVNEGLGGVSLDKKTTTGKDGEDEEDDDDKSVIEKFIEDVKAVPGNILRDLKMGIDAGFYGNYDQARKNLRNAKNPDGSRKYTDAEIDSWIAATKKTKQDQMNEQAQGSAQDGDDPKPVVGDEVVDPCPEGFKLDPASGICVPDEQDDTEEEEDSGDDKEDTSDDELSGVVTTPPPPTSYLDNAPMMMKRGGSVGLNRAADNFLAAMGA